MKKFLYLIKKHPITCLVLPLLWLGGIFYTLLGNGLEIIADIFPITEPIDALAIASGILLLIAGLLYIRITSYDGPPY